MSTEPTKKLPTISVVIPVHNRICTIGKCLDSVLNQTFPPNEIIVVDDCSTDGTVEIVRGVDDLRIRLIQLPQSVGAQAARNAGIRAAVNEWIAFQDSDDEWLPDKLAMQVERLGEVTTGFFTVVHTDGWLQDVQGKTKSLIEMVPVDGERPLARLLSGGGPMFQGILTSKKALETIGFLDEKLPAYQEWETCIRLASICRFVHLREPLFLYNRHEGETISSDLFRSIEGYLYIIEKHKNEILCHLSTKGYDAHLRFCAMKFMRAQEFSRALAVMKISKGHSIKNLVLRLMCLLRISRIP